jgi:hypothetical protein
MCEVEMKAFWFPSLVLLTVGGPPSFTQSGLPGVAITDIQGRVDVDGQSTPKLESVLPENSLVRTAKGRAQIRFGSGDSLFLGENSSMRVRHNARADSDEPEILDGSAVVITGGIGPVVSCVQGVQLSDAGIFRFDVHRATGETFCRLKVYGGAAAVQMPSFMWMLTIGKTIDLNRSCGDHTPRNEFDVDEIDDLDRWSRQRRSAGPRL